MKRILPVLIALLASSCFAPLTRQESSERIYSCIIGDFEEITETEYRQAETNLRQCTQFPDTNISPMLKQKIVEEIFDKVLGDDGREFAREVDTLMSVYGYYPALGMIIADAAKGDSWGQQRGWLFDTTGCLLCGGFCCVKLRVRVDGLMSAFGISSSGCPSVPDTLFLFAVKDNGHVVDTLMQRRFANDTLPATITDWWPVTTFWGADSALYLMGHPSLDSDRYDLDRHVYYKLRPKVYTSSFTTYPIAL